MEKSKSENQALALRTILALALIILAAALRIAPHPWNLTPVGAIAVFSGAVLRDRRLAFLFPVLALLAGDLFLGFNILSPLVYLSFLVNAVIGRLLAGNRTVARIGGATLLGALQFFLLTNFGVWAFLNTFPHTASGLLGCYAAGLPLFWNTLAGDALYASLLFGSFALAERLFPQLRHAQWNPAG